jgi:alkyl hydroperoxide reductase subunit AhpC
MKQNPGAGDMTQREVARKYGVYRKQDGMTERALFVIDKDGIIR